MSLRYKAQAFGSLFAHYRNVFRYYWAARNENEPGRYTALEAEFLPAALTLQERPLSPVTRILGWLLTLLVLAALGWATIGRMDIVVNAEGKIIPTQRTKVIASIETASVKALFVEEGQFVKKGARLVELDTTASDMERDKALGDEAIAKLQAARARALINSLKAGKPPTLGQVTGISGDELAAAQRQITSQYADFQAKLQRINGDIERYTQTLPLAVQRANDYRELASTHDVAEHAYTEKQQAVLDLKGQLADARNQRIGLSTETARLAYESLTEATRTISEMDHDASKANSHSKLLTLTAPVDGTVQQLVLHTVGGVVPSAQELMVIVPKESVVEVEAAIANKDIGFVQEGQSAQVKVDAFEYTKYGTIPARVTHVSRDAIADDKKVLTYLARVTLDRADIDVDGHVVPLSPGMTVNVEIKTGTRRVIEYLISPLLQHQRESFNER